MYGKNIGRVNETSPYQQCLSEAQSKWNKQVDKGYTPDLPTKKLLRPMLAHRYDKHGKKMEFPCLAQPKLDGIRCLGFRDRIESRLGKPFKTLPHIKKAVREQLKGTGIKAFDGELYLHGELFQDLTKAIKRDTAIEASEDIEFHIYDYVCEKGTFVERWGKIHELGLEWPLVPVPTIVIESPSEIAGTHEGFLDQGYEGMMLRNKAGLYKIDGRSFDLQKVKAFMDEEFEIVDVTENENRPGTPTFVCKIGDDTFRTQPQGSNDYRASLWQDRKNLLGKRVTVEFFEYTAAGIPRFPVAKVIRDYE